MFVHVCVHTLRVSEVLIDKESFESLLDFRLRDELEKMIKSLMTTRTLTGERTLMSCT